MKFSMFLFISTLVLLTLKLSGQTKHKSVAQNMYDTPKDTSNISGNVTFYEHSNIRNLINKHIEINREKEIPGWRVLIYLNSGYGAQNEAKKLIETFKKKYPDTGAYLKFQYPHFRVVVGDFRKNEKSKALKLKQELYGRFSNSCWIVDDNIELPPLDEK